MPPTTPSRRIPCSGALRHHNDSATTTFLRGTHPTAAIPKFRPPSSLINAAHVSPRTKNKLGRNKESGCPRTASSPRIHYTFPTQGFSPSSIPRTRPQTSSPSRSSTRPVRRHRDPAQYRITGAAPRDVVLITPFH